MVKSRNAFGALLATPGCAIDVGQNGEMLTKESFFLGEESGLSETFSSYGNESNNDNDDASIRQFFNSVWPCPRGRVQNRSRMNFESLTALLDEVAVEVVSRIGCC